MNASTNMHVAFSGVWNPRQKYVEVGHTYRRAGYHPTRTER